MFMGVLWWSIFPVRRRLAGPFPTPLILEAEFPGPATGRPEGKL